MANEGCIFIGTKERGLCALRDLAETLPGKVRAAITIDDSADPQSVLSELGQFALQHQIPFHVLQKPSELAPLVSQYGPQFAFVANWYWILPQELLDSLPGGFVGIHCSMLPKFRGSAPLVWPILLGHEESGVTLFHFDSGMDTGDIVGQHRFTIGPDDTIAEVLQKAADSTTHLIRAYAGPLASGTAPRTQQEHSSATYASARRPEDGRIDWSQPAEKIRNFVRAQTRPYPGAFTETPNGKTVRVWRVEKFQHPYFGIPGLVALRTDMGFVVTCGDDEAVTLVDFEVEDAAAGSALKWGMRLG